MAPLITITIHALLGSVGVKPEYHQTQLATPIPKPCHDQPVKPLGPVQGTNSLSTISWGLNRMDVYGQNAENGTISHKWWDGYQWGPSVATVEDLGAEAAAAPVAVSWGKDRMDVFSRGFNNELVHKYWDGQAWKPDETSFDSLGGSLEIGGTSLAATAWSTDRLDVFGIGAADGALLHKYWDGSQWNPEDGLESLSGDFVKGVSAVSWGEGRNDVFAIDAGGKLLHVYYDGTNWSDWEDMVVPVDISEPTVISWGINRLDVFAISLDAGSLWHTAWDGSQWLPWETLGGSGLVGPVSAVSWGANRMDIVALSQDTGYYYKYWDGSQWNPTDATLYPKGGNFSSVPSLVSWGDNRLDIFGVTADADLGHQTWYGSGWYPEWGFEKLGGVFDTDSIHDAKVPQEL